MRTICSRSKIVERRNLIFFPEKFAEKSATLYSRSENLFLSNEQGANVVGGWGGWRKIIDHTPFHVA